MRRIKAKTPHDTTGDGWPKPHDSLRGHSVAGQPSVTAHRPIRPYELHGLEPLVGLPTWRTRYFSYGDHCNGVHSHKMVLANIKIVSHST